MEVFVENATQLLSDSKKHLGVVSTTFEQLGKLLEDNLGRVQNLSESWKKEKAEFEATLKQRDDEIVTLKIRIAQLEGKSDTSRD